MQKLLNTTLKISAIFLWYFVALFFFIVWDMNQANRLFKEGTTLGDMMVRHPYQWDFELFFAGLFLIWGISLWRASRNTQKDSALIKFTGWAFLIHAITMLIVGAIKQEDLKHEIDQW